MLGVSLLEIAESADELFAGNVFVVGEEVSLGGLTGVVDEDVGIGSHAGDGANHVTRERSAIRFDECRRHLRFRILVEDVKLLRRGVLLQELGCDLALGGEDNAILGEDTNGGTGVGDGL